MFNQRQWDQVNAFAASFAGPSQSQGHGNGSRPFQGGNAPSVPHAHQSQQQQQQQQQHPQHINHNHGTHQQPQYGFSRGEDWPSYGMHTDSAASVFSNSQQNLGRDIDMSAAAGEMDWTPSNEFAGTSFHAHSMDQYHDNGTLGNSANLANLGSYHDNSGANGFGNATGRGDDNGMVADRAGGGGSGVGRLVAQFENKAPNPPMLPPRPNNSVTSPIAINHHLSQQTHQEQPSSPFDHFNASAQGNSLNANSLNTNSFVQNRFTSPADSNFGSFGGHQSPVTSPIATSPPPIGFGSFHDASRVTSPIAAPSSDPFGSIDFLASNQMDHTMATSPLVTSPVPTTPGSGLTAGTPGFAIWRPGQQQDQQQQQQQQQNHDQSVLQHHLQQDSFHHQQQHHQQEDQKPSINNTQPTKKPSLNNVTSPGGHYRPPIPATPKPAMPIGNQFILELNPGSKAKGKAPAKPPRPRAPKPAASSYCTTVKQEPSTPQISEIPSSSSSAAPASGEPSASRQAAAVNRSSREQVPAEAWEGFKTTIRDLYLEQRKPLKEVMSIMAEKYNFQATPKMYKTRFSQWGFVKNNTEDEVKRLLSMKFQRDAEGKVSEFVRNGKIVNLGTYLKRKGVTEYDLVDFELPADLPSHIRCRTPTPPPAPDYLKSPDLMRAQELVVGNARKAFAQCRQVELEIERHVAWSSIMVWGAPSSDALTEANFFFEAGDVDQGGKSLMTAFNQLEVDLRQLSPQGIIEVMLAMVRRDPGLMTALCKYVAAFATTNYDRSHPLRQIFTCLYEVQQKHGAATLSDLLWGSAPLVADELEAIYGHRHPYVARNLVDLSLIYEHKNPERLEKLLLDLRVLHRQAEQQHAAEQGDLMSLRYAIAQIAYAANPDSDASKQAAKELWKDMKKMKLTFGVREARPNTFCYHCPVKNDPWNKRCRRRYDSVVELLEKHVGVKVLPYFEEDHHITHHEMDAQTSWAVAMGQSIGGNKWGYI